jgi:hypothetical protein
MRYSLKIDCFLISASILTAGISVAAPASSLTDKLAEQNFAMGAEVNLVEDYRLDDRIYLDSRHVILPGGASGSYLLNLAKDCHGLYANRIIPRARTKNQLAPGDRLMIKHEGRNVDSCEIVSIYELNPK